MDTARKYAIVVGVLFIIATAFLFIGEAVYGPILESPDYLEIAYPNRTTAVLGILLEFACVIAIPLIPVFAYPILKEHSPALAVGYVGFRLFEAVLFAVTEINKLSLISVSQGYLSGGEGAAAYFQNLGASIQAQNGWIFSFYLFIFTLGGLIFYSALYRSRLVPRFISGWGFLAAALLLAGTVLQMLEVNLMLPAGAFELVFAAPIAVNEMVLAVWLIAKGFNTSTVASEVMQPMQVKAA